MNVGISADGNLFELKDFYVKQEADNGTVFEITDVDKIQAMSTALMENKQVTFKMEGEVASNPASFKIEVTAQIEIVANPL